MAVSRYDEREIVENSLESYKDQLDNRNVKTIKHYSTPVLEYPTDEEKGNLDVRAHIWKVGDRFYKLATEFYGSPEYWWIIAWYNRAPTESHFNLGDVVYIPKPLEAVLEYYNL